MSDHVNILVSEIVSMLTARIQPLVEELLPNGRRDAQEWRCGSIQGEPGRSLGVHLRGAKAGVWRDFAGDDGGDALDLVQAVLGLSKAEAVRWAKGWLGIDGNALAPRLAPTTRPHPPAADHADDARQRLEAAMKIWRKTQPAAGTLVETYLKARGITIPAPPTLRCAAALKHGPTGLRLPAMVAAVQGADRSVVGIHRTFLTMSGTCKAAVSTPRMSLGPIAGGAVRLGPARSPLAIAEGIETALAVAQACPELSVWAALSTSGLKALVLPAEVHQVKVIADGDEPGQEAARALAARLVSEGREVRIAQAPDGQDFADVLNEGAAV